MPPAALWCAARHTSVQDAGHPGAMRTRCFPKVAALGPEASDSAPPSTQACRLHSAWASKGVGGLTAVRPLRAMRPLGASTRPRPSGRPSPATGLAVTHARRRETLRTSRSPNRQVGGHLLRCSRSPGASADSLTRHATPAVSSCCTTLPPHHWSLGPSRYAFCRSAIPRFTHSPTRRGPAAAAQHSPGRVLSLSLRQ